jgi:hypothetical protein
MNILTNQAPRVSPQRQNALPKANSDQVTFSGGGDSFVKTAIGTGIGSAIGFGLGSAAAMGGFAGGTVGALTGLATGTFILARLGDGKGGEGLIYPIAGAAIGGIGGAVLGALGGSHMSWVGAAAGGLAVLQALR